MLNVRRYNKRCTNCYKQLLFFKDIYSYIDVSFFEKQIKSILIMRVDSHKTYWKISTERKNIYKFNDFYKGKINRKRACFSNNDYNFSTFSFKKNAIMLLCEKCSYWEIISEDNQLDLVSNKEKYLGVKNRCRTF